MMARVVTSFFILVAMITGSVQMQKLLKSENFSTNISHMAASPSGDIYIGTRNKIYHLDSDLKLISSAVMGTALESENFMNVLLLVESFPTDMGLMTCAVLSGCQIRNQSNISMYRNITRSKSEATNSGLGTLKPDPILFLQDGCIRMGSTYDLSNVYLTRGFSNSKLNDEKTGLVSCGIPNIMNSFNELLFKDIKNFVYGFSIGSLDYYFMNQRLHGPTVFKFCQMYPHAYSEMPIRCAGEEYTVLKAMQYIGINQTDGLLVGVFTTEDEFRSAVCLFKYSEFQKVMVENIKQCFNGTDNQKRYLKTQLSCMKLDSYTASDSEYLCPSLRFYNKVIGSSPALGELIFLGENYSFKSLTAVGVVHISRRTLFVLGSRTGQVDEISQNTDGSWSIWKSFDLRTSSSIGRDILFDPSRRHIYVFSKSQVFKFQLHNCDEYKYCHSCLAPKNHTVCGWCVLQNKCGILEDCESTVWLQRPAKHGCPAVRNITPPVFQINATQRHVQVQLNHKLPSGNIYFCKLPYSDERFPATSEEHSVSCDLPFLWNYSNLSAEGLMLVNVSILSNWSDNPVVSGILTVYDCSHVTKTVKTLNERITNSHYNLLLNVNPVTALKPAKIFLPAVINHGNNHTSRRDNISNGDICTQCARTDFSCAWCLTGNKCINKHENCSDRDIMGTYKCTLGPNNDYGVGERLNSTTVCCKFNVNTTMTNATGVIVASLMPLLEPSTLIEIDNSREMKVEIYQCEYLAGDDCGLCKSYTIVDHPVYECQWCGNTCQYRDEISCAENDCPPASITKVTPLTAHFDTSADITIEGKNLGFRFADVLNSITIGAKPCTPIEKEYLPSRRIVCRLEPFGRQARVDVTVSLPGKANVTYTEQYSFQRPIITNIFPKIGPKSGGSFVKITGQLLDTGNDRSVIIGDIICSDIRQVTFSSVTCFTEANRGNVSGLKVVSMNFSGALEIGINVTFEYKDDPTIWNISPRTSFNGGGRQIIITGGNLNIIQQPKIYVVYNNGTNTPNRICTHVNSTAIVCPSPRNVHTNSVEDPEPRMAFIMDGVHSVSNVAHYFSNVSSEMRYVEDPSIKAFETPVMNKEILIIKGSRLTDAADKEDVTVFVGNGNCNLTALTSEQIICRPPSDKPKGPACDNSTDDQQKSMTAVDMKITVKIGDIRFFAGCLRYGSQSDQQPNLFIIIATAAGGVILTVVMSIVIAFVVTKRKIKKQKMDFMLQMDRIKSEVRNQRREGHIGGTRSVTSRRIGENEQENPYDYIEESEFYLGASAMNSPPLESLMNNENYFMLSRPDNDENEYDRVNRIAQTPNNQ